MKIIDFSNAEYSIRDGIYGGLSGDKDGVLYNGEFWIIKFPRSTKALKNVKVSYTSSPLSEYIGSHIYEILGFDVHKTVLGYRNDKIVVGCKDFCKTMGSLVEMRTIKNAANKELSEKVEASLHSTSSSHNISLEEIMLHLDFNRILKNIPGIKERFWDCIVVDILINNKDRNNGNWGLLIEDDKYKIAPVFDNGSSFYNRTSDEQIEKYFEDNNKLKEQFIHLTSLFSYNDIQLTYEKLINLEIDDLKKSILKMAPLINTHIEDFCTLIDSIPTEYNGIIIMSDIRKKFYEESLKARNEILIMPRYYEIKKENGLLENINNYNDLLKLCIINAVYNNKYNVTIDELLGNGYTLNDLLVLKDQLKSKPLPSLKIDLDDNEGKVIKYKNDFMSLLDLSSLNLEQDLICESNTDHSMEM